jgi:hypothetical protein
MDLNQVRMAEIEAFADPAQLHGRVLPNPLQGHLLSLIGHPEIHLAETTTVDRPLDPDPGQRSVTTLKTVH